jgi:hypothetical protein
MNTELHLPHRLSSPHIRGTSAPSPSSTARARATRKPTPLAIGVAVVLVATTVNTAKPEMEVS